MRDSRCFFAFQSTHSVRSATRARPRLILRRQISIHALRAECDIWCTLQAPLRFHFNPRTPCGVRPFLRKLLFGLLQISIHALRAECDQRDAIVSKQKIISIHALRAECDTHPHQYPYRKNNFNPRTPCGVRLIVKVIITILTKFQSTHSVRSATLNIHVMFSILPHFNPRTPCGVRPFELFGSIPV